MGWGNPTLDSGDVVEEFRGVLLQEAEVLDLVVSGLEVGAVRVENLTDRLRVLLQHVQSLAHLLTAKVRATVTGACQGQRWMCKVKSYQTR